MDDYQELIERLRYEGYDVSRNEAANAIESLLAENERLNHNLTSTEQTMREYQELAAKRLEEIERLKDLCTTMDGQLGKRPCQNNRCLEYNRLAAELAKYRDAPVVAYIRKWAFDGEEPKKEKRENGRLAWPFKFKLIPVSQSMLLKDDIPLIVKPGEEK